MIYILWKKGNINCIVGPTIYPTRGDHASHYTTDTTTWLWRKIYTQISRKVSNYRFGKISKMTTTSKIVSDEPKTNKISIDQIENNMFYWSFWCKFQHVNYRVFHDGKNLQKCFGIAVLLIVIISSLENKPPISLSNLSHANHRGSWVTYILSLSEISLPMFTESSENVPFWYSLIVCPLLSSSFTFDFVRLYL
jgi:hypothetical protein